MKGVEIVFGDLDQPGSIRRALRGATVIFGVTDFWQHLKDPEVQRQAAEWEGFSNEIAFRREIEQGKVRDELIKYGSHADQVQGTR